MAGAVSAGAYTAGVMDYLIEALDEWQRKKDSGEAGVPQHHVEIPVIGGASAGGMTGIITAAAIQDPILPVREAPENLFQKMEQNKFYHSWVDLLSDDMLSVMLDSGDISSHGLSSALNSDFIDTIAKRAIQVTGTNPVRRKYFSERLKLFVTLSNLRGMDYSVAFKSMQTENKKRDRHLITIHNDYVTFRLVPEESDYADDGWIPLNFAKGLNTQTAMVAAMATGAFPAGLKARIVEREGKYLNDHKWFDDITKKAYRPFRRDKPISTINVDGGMINNEPFEKVQDVLMDITGQRNPELFRNYHTFKGTVLMIDPFPSEFDEEVLGKKYDKETLSTKLLTVIGGTLGALIGQSRIKPSVLIDAWESDNAAQFLIAPVRYEGDNAIDGSKAIACGALSGFAGFISKEFRIHDYFLGRANCEKFLRDHFTVPEDTTNPIFREGYAQVPEAALQKLRARGGGLPIIPIFTERKAKPYMPAFSNGSHWPTLSESAIHAYKRKIGTRVHAIVMQLSDSKGFGKILIGLLARIFVTGKISNAVLTHIADALKKHKLLR